jgi:hypothetical protein
VPREVDRFVKRKSIAAKVKELIARALKLNGSLVAHATARLMGLA